MSKTLTQEQVAERMALMDSSRREVERRTAPIHVAVMAFADGSGTRQAVEQAVVSAGFDVGETDMFIAELTQEDAVA